MNLKRIIKKLDSSITARDILTICVAAIALFLLAVKFQIFERFASWIEQHKGWRAGEIAITLFALALGIAILSWRSRRKLKAELTEHSRAKAALRESYEQLQREVEEQRRAEEALHAEREQYRQIVEHANDIIYKADAKGYFTFCNPTASRIMKYSRAELIGMHFIQLVRPDYHKDIEEFFRQQFTNHLANTYYEFPAITKDGAEVWIGQNVQLLMENEKIVGFQAVARDITELKRSQAALHKAEEYRNLFRHANDAILIFDPENEIVLDVNDRACEVYGIAREDFIGRSLRDISLDVDRGRRELGKLLTEGAQREFETVQFRGDGTPINFLVNSAVIEFQGKRAVLSINRDITERKRAEDALREFAKSKEESLALLDTILSSAPIGFAFHNCDLVYERINESLAIMNGKSVEQHLGRTLREILPEMADSLEPIMRKVIETGEPIKDIELSGITPADPDREHFWLASYYPVQTQNKEMLGVGVLISDITAHKQSVQALRESEARYRLLFENNPHPMWVYDLQTLDFLTVNEAAVLRYGYSREEFLAMTIKDIRPQEDVPALLEKVSKAGGGIDEAGVWKHRKKDGSLIDVEIISHELMFDGRRAELVLANDVTERRRVEEMQARRASQTALRSDINAALAESGISLQSILERCAGAIVNHLEVEFASIWTLDKEGAPLKMQASAGMQTFEDGPHAIPTVGAFKIGLIAKEREPYITNDVQNDPHIGDKEWAKREGMSAFAGYPLVVEDRLVGVMAIFARRKLAEDTFDALSSVADIISQGIERKRAEEALRASEGQLRQSQKLEAVGQLAGGIAHDFNNLLAVVLLHADLLLKRLAVGDPARRRAEEIKAASERAAALTRQLLAFSRKQVLQPKIVNLNDIVSNMGKMLRRLIGEDIETFTSLDPSLGRIQADPGQLEQVIMNLAVNARDAMPRGGKLMIETKNVYLTEEYASRHMAVKPGHYVKLAVSDTGCGMDKETQSRVFEPFFTTKEVGKGTGLGLSTVYGIVKQSGGNLWVYSEKGVGTSFKVYLPRADEVIDENELIEEEEEEVLHGHETVLLVEDEEMVRRVAREVLELQEYHVLEAQDGEEALHVSANYDGPIHLLLTDVVMPGMSGRDVAEELLRDRPQMRILYMSGYTDDAIVHHGVLDEGTVFIEKPFSPTDLARKLRGLLDER
jgi:two-component system, cell cycle sensor histidine kinase and response regulator CckA